GLTRAVEKSRRERGTPKSTEPIPQNIATILSQINFLLLTFWIKIQCIEYDRSEGDVLGLSGWRGVQPLAHPKCHFCHPFVTGRMKRPEAACTSFVRPAALPRPM